MNPIRITQNLKNEALTHASGQVEKHLHYNGHKSIKGRRGYSEYQKSADHQTLTCIFTFYASGRTRCTFHVGFLDMNQNEAIQWLKDN